MSDRFERPRRADTETPEPVRRQPAPLPRPDPPLTDEERAHALERLNQLRRDRFGKRAKRLPGEADRS